MNNIQRLRSSTVDWTESRHAVYDFSLFTTKSPTDNWANYRLSATRPARSNYNSKSNNSHNSANTTSHSVVSYLNDAETA